MRTAELDGPLQDNELAALFAPIAETSRVALAVSGGVDSLALLVCVARWRSGRETAPDVLVLTVDHSLRRQSASDAAGVVATARKFGLPSRVLKWRGAKPKSDIEAAARAARYRLLLEAATEAGASHLLLAHQRDDQAETFLLRLARSSGLFGLAAMRSEIPAGEVTIFRPFLEIGRSRLSATVEAAGLTPVVDEMNSDPRFARTRIRRLLPLLAGEGIDSGRLAATARRLVGAAEAIDAAAGALIAACVAFDDFAVASIELGMFLASEKEIRLRALVRLLLAVGGDDYPPRFERLDALAGAMEAHRGGRFKRTLAGAVVEWRAGRFIIYRELGRAGLPVLPLRSGMRAVWDHRFEVAVGSGAPAGLKVAALGEAGRKAVGARAGATAAGALAALPALWREETVHAVPVIGYNVGSLTFPFTMRSIVAGRAASAPRFPDFLGPD